MPLRVSVIGRCRLEAGVHDHAVDKLGRLERHTPRLREVRLTLDGTGRAPVYTAEVVSHLPHTTLVCHASAATQREAVDRVVDTADRQVLRHKDRVLEHKGHAPAGADPRAPRPRRTDPLKADI